MSFSHTVLTTVVIVYGMIYGRTIWCHPEEDGLLGINLHLERADNEWTAVYTGHFECISSDHLWFDFIHHFCWKKGFTRRLLHRPSAALVFKQKCLANTISCTCRGFFKCCYHTVCSRDSEINGRWGQGPKAWSPIKTPITIMMSK